MRRVASRVAVAILSLFALYVVGINVFLSTRLFEMAFNQDPETIFVAFERGWSIWPGRVHAKNLTIRFSDSKVQFVLRLDTCDFTFAIHELALEKTFHVTRVNGSGVTFRARQRLASPEAIPEFVDALPPIPGFERIPLQMPGPPNFLEQYDDAHWHLFTVDLDNAVAENVRDIWVDGVRWQGDARITGGFYLKPIRFVHLDDIHVDVRGGRITALQRVVVEPIAGTIMLDIAGFDPRITSLAELLTHITARTDLHGRVPDLASFPPSLFAPAMISGPVELRRVVVNIVKGRLTGGAHVDVAAPGIALEQAGHRVTGDLSLLADVADDAGGPRLTLRSDARGLVAKRLADAPGVLVTVLGLSLTGDSRALDLREPFADLHATASLEGAQLPDARRLEAYVPAQTRKSLSLRGGSAKARGSLELWRAERRAKGEVAIDAEAFDVRVAKARVQTGLGVQASVAAYHWDTNRLEGLKARVRVAGTSVAHEEAPQRSLIEASLIEVGFDGPEIDLADPLRAFSATVAVPQADIIDRGLLARALRGGGDVQLAGGHARFDGKGELEVHDHVASGSAAIHASRLGLTVDDRALTIDMRANARVHDWELARGRLVVDDASVVLSNLDLTAAAGEASAFSVRRVALQAKSARFDVAVPFENLLLAGSIEGARFGDPRGLNALLPEASALRFDTEPGKGSFDAKLQATFEHEVGRASLALRGQGLGGRGKKLGIRGDVEASVEISDWRVNSKTLRLQRSRVAFSDVAVRIGEREPGALSGAPDLTVKRVELRASIDAFDLAHPTVSAVDYRVILEDARMDDVRPLKQLLAAKDPYAFAIESGNAHAAMDIEVKGSTKTAAGQATIELANAGVRLHATHLVGDFQMIPLENGFDAELDGLNITGSTITMRNLKTVGAKVAASSWDADATLLGGAVRVTEDPAFDALVQIKADDATPVLALALQNRLPTFVVGMLKAPRLSGQARIAISAERSAILGARLRGDDVVLVGNYVVAGNRVRGAATVAKGLISAGVSVDDAGTYVRLFKLESWMKEQTAASMALFGEPKPKTVSRPSSTPTTP